MDFILQDKTYNQEMDETVLPFLDEHRKCYSLEREAGKPLHVEVFSLKKPKALVLVSHGFTENTVKYRENLYYLLKAGYSVVMPDHCGHGESYRLVDDPSLVQVDDWSRYMHDFIFVSDWAREKFPGLTTYLFAHSMGGGVGACVAGARPDLFEKIVLCSPMIRPLTGPLPWKAAMRIAENRRRRGKGGEYIVGQKPYSGIVDFKHSVTDSPERYFYYEKIREKTTSLQTAACTYDWILAARDMAQYIHSEAAAKTKAEILLFQAGADTLVSAPDQDAYIQELWDAHPGHATMIRVPGIKHEIFNAPYPVVNHFWDIVFRFYAE